MIAKLLNRAYARLNDVLDLAGTTALNAIEMDAAFPVHPLDAVVEGSVGENWELYGEFTSTGAGIQSFSLDVFTDAVWDLEVRDGLAANFNPSRENDDILVRHVWLAAGSNVNNAVIYEVITSRSNARRPVTNVLVGDGSFDYVSGDNEPYYARGMPFLHTRDDDITLRATVDFAGIITVQYGLSLFLAPRGTIRPSLSR